jgi:hypothetical protein
MRCACQELLLKRIFVFFNITMNPLLKFRDKLHYFWKWNHHFLRVNSSLIANLLQYTIFTVYAEFFPTDKISNKAKKDFSEATGNAFHLSIFTFSISLLVYCWFTAASHGVLLEYEETATKQGFR